MNFVYEKRMGDNTMLTRFGMFCRKLRIDNNELLLDMAKRLSVSSAFLSKVENGKSKPPIKWKETIASLYDLGLEQETELCECIDEARKKNDKTNIVLDKIAEEIRHFMFEVNPSSSESDYACNYILDFINEYKNDNQEKE